MYQRYLKRAFDVACALAALIVFSWLYIIIAILVRINMGSPVLFAQKRPGLVDSKTGKERIFTLYKFRTMTDAHDKRGKLLSDAERLTRFGRFLRSTSLDELPEAINILKGDMSVIGPRPQLVRDMVFMSKDQRRRHTVRPGLSGLAQIEGRNAISWEGKLAADLRYIEKITFAGDLAIIFKTVLKVVRRSDISSEGCATGEDFGDYLLNRNRISRAEYDAGQALAAQLLAESE